MKKLIFYSILLFVFSVACSDQVTEVLSTENNQAYSSQKPIVSMELKGKVVFEDGTVFESKDSTRTFVIPAKYVGYIKPFTKGKGLTNIPERQTYYVTIFNGNGSYMMIYPHSFQRFFVQSLKVDTTYYQGPNISASVLANLSAIGGETHFPSFYSNFSDGSDNYSSSTFNRTFFSPTRLYEYRWNTTSPFTWAYYYKFTNGNIDFGNVMIDCTSMDTSLYLFVSNVTFVFSGINTYQNYY